MTQSIIKGVSDNKQYRFVELPNGLKILLISEPMQSFFKDMETDESNDITENGEDNEQGRLAATALCVNVGSFCDPGDVQGLAHYLEHMLFLGSEKYPVENHLDDYLTSHSGHSNAFTEGDQTVYYFAVAQDFLEGALDIFGSCLIAPLLQPEASDREVKAVQSEFEDNILEDSSRRLQMIAMLADKDHPFSCFAFGNTESLVDIPKEKRIDVNKELRKFFSKYYTSDRMYLTVQSHHSLDKMQSWLDIFAKIPQAPSRVVLPNSTTYTFPFDMNSFARIYRVCPVRDMHELIMTWSLPPLLDRYLEKPHHYLSFILGDESTGSLISFLRKKRLALQLVAGNDESGDEHNYLWCKYSLNIQLTDEGVERYEEVLQYVYAFLEMLRVVGPQKRIFEELSYINQYRFDYQDESEAVDNVNTLCQHMKLFPQHHILNGAFIFTKWQPDNISNCLNLLKPEECNIVLSSKRFESLVENSTEMEPWFKTKFISESLKPNWWMEISEDEWSVFSIPAPNSFIPEDFTVKEIHDEPIKLIDFGTKGSGSRCWYKPGAIHYAQPKACVYLNLFGDIFGNNLRNRTAIDIYLAILQFYLVEKLYPANVTGLKCSIKLHDFSKMGINIRFFGFSDKIMSIVNVVLNEIINFSFTEDVFHILSAEIQRDCKNSCVLPMDFGHQVRLASLLNDYIGKFQRTESQSSNSYFEISDFNNFLNDWRNSKNCMLDCFISGNVSETEARRIFDLCEGVLQPLLCLSTETSMKETALVNKTQCAVVDSYKNSGTRVVCVERLTVKGDNNFAVIAYYQLGCADFQNYCISQLYEMIVSEPCFNVLRTQKQLGYNCFFEMHNSGGTIGFSVIVQSSHTEFNPKLVSQEIDSFMESTVEYIASLSEHEFQDQVDALIELKLSPFGSLKAEVRYYWLEILNHGGRMFDRREKEAEFLENLSQSQIVDFARNLLKLNKQLVVQVIDPAETSEKFKPSFGQKLRLCFPKEYPEKTGFIEDFQAFKKSQIFNPHIEI